MSVLSLRRAPERVRSFAIRPLTLAFVTGLAAFTLAAPPKMTPLPGSLRGTANSGTRLGTLEDEELVQFAVVLSIDSKDLEAFVQQVSNPSSPLYRQFLTPEQIAANYGASQADINSVTSYLESFGVKVTGVGKTHFAIFAEGTASQVQKALKTTLIHVQRDEDGSVYRTNSEPIYFPADLAPKIQCVYGLDNSRRMVRRQNTTLLNPTLYRTGYNVNTAYASGYYGQGRNIAIANWDGFRLNNLTKFYPAYSLPTPSGGIGSNVTVTVVGGGTGYGSGEPAGEGDLDIQNTLQSAPLCNLHIYDDNTSDTSAPLSTYDQIASDDTADVVTESYGWATYYYAGSRHGTGTKTYYGSECTADHNEHLAIAAEGITYLAASGDSGAAAFTHVTSGSTSAYSYCYPDIDPEVLMVGGSELTVNSSTGARVSEVPWGVSGGVGGTGGFDVYDTPANGFAFNVAPSYQTSYISSFTSKYNYRLVPDIVSQAGGQNGLGSETSSSGWAYTIFYNYGRSYPLGTQILIDGTSCASPAVAGSLGVVLDQLYSGTTANSSRSNVRLGLLQPWLYSKGGTASIFNNISTGTGVGTIPGTTVAANPAVGWNLATGWGSLNFAGLYNALVSSGY